MQLAKCARHFSAFSAFLHRIFLRGREDGVGSLTTFSNPDISEEFQIKLKLLFNQYQALFVFSIYSEIRETEEFLNGTTKNNKYYYATEKGMRGFLQLKKQRKRHRGSSLELYSIGRKKCFRAC